MKATTKRKTKKTVTQTKAAKTTSKKITPKVSFRATKGSRGIFSTLATLLKRSLHAAKALVEMTRNMSVRTKLYFVLGFMFLVISIGWHLNQTIQLMLFTPKVVPVENIYAIPTEVKIPKVGVDLPIEQTAITNGIWQVSEKGASHLTVSARPGEEGPIIMYSHNTNERFGPIRWLAKGESIQLKTADGKTHTYKIVETMTVAANKMDVLTKKRGEALLLYTCDGFADLQRFVVVAVPAK